MNRDLLKKNICQPVDRVSFVTSVCNGKTVLDVGCVEHSAANAANDTWIHKAISEVAEHTVGVDYLEEDVRKLVELGYNIICADVTKRIPLEETFDVIIVGNLIEHITNFDAFFENIHRLLAPGGRCFISTANPFYSEQYYYSAFKGDIIVNPEHTCWICPYTLSQIVERYSLAVSEVFWIKEKWPLGKVILNSTKREFDMYEGKWRYRDAPSMWEKTVISVLCAFPPVKKRTEALAKKHGPEDAKRLVFQKLVSAAFGVTWRMYKLILPRSRLNSYELYFAEISRR